MLMSTEWLLIAVMALGGDSFPGSSRILQIIQKSEQCLGLSNNSRSLPLNLEFSLPQSATRDVALVFGAWLQHQRSLP